MTTYLLQEFLSELVVSRHEKRDSQLMELNEMPLYPTEVRPKAHGLVWKSNSCNLLNKFIWNVQECYDMGRYIRGLCKGGLWNGGVGCGGLEVTVNLFKCEGGSTVQRYVFRLFTYTYYPLKWEIQLRHNSYLYFDSQIYLREIWNFLEHFGII